MFTFTTLLILFVPMPLLILLSFIDIFKSKTKETSGDYIAEEKQNLV